MSDQEDTFDYDRQVFIYPLLRDDSLSTNPVHDLARVLRGQSALMETECGCHAMPGEYVVFICGHGRFWEDIGGNLLECKPIHIPLQL